MNGSSRVHDGRSFGMVTFKGHRVGEPSCRRSSRGSLLTSTMKSNEIMRLEDLRHSLGDYLRDSSLSAERRGFLEFGKLALMLFIFVAEGCLSVLKCRL